jgi:hypothetical protein
VQLATTAVGQKNHNTIDLVLVLLCRRIDLYQRMLGRMVAIRFP